MKRTKLLSSILVMGMTLAMASPAQAANVSDTSLPSKAAGYDYSKAAYTTTRAKENTTSHYVYNKGSFDLWIRSFSGSRELTVGGYAIVPKKSERFVRNWVYEEGYRSCKLEITARNQSDAGKTISGLWSPDSVGSYPNAN